MKNKPIDLVNHLFAQIERLGEEDLAPEELEREVARAGAMVKVADAITTTYSMQIKASCAAAEWGDRGSMKSVHLLPDDQGKLEEGQ